VVAVSPRWACGETLGRSPGAVFPQGRCAPVGEGDRACARGRLRGANDEAFSGHVLQRSVDTQASRLEIDVGPLEAEELAATQTETEREHGERFEPIASRGVEDRARFLRGRSVVESAAAALGAVDEHSDVSIHDAVLLRVPQRASQHSACVALGARREAGLLEFAQHAVDMARGELRHRHRPDVRRHVLVDDEPAARGCAVLHRSGKHFVEPSREVVRGRTACVGDRESRVDRAANVGQAAQRLSRGDVSEQVRQVRPIGKTCPPFAVPEASDAAGVGVEVEVSDIDRGARCDGFTLLCANSRARSERLSSKAGEECLVGLLVSEDHAEHLWWCRPRATTEVVWWVASRSRKRGPRGG
jgi:hypothetical protein